MVDGKNKATFCRNLDLDILMRAWVSVYMFLKTSLYIWPIKVAAECGWQLTWNSIF